MLTPDTDITYESSQQPLGIIFENESSDLDKFLLINKYDNLNITDVFVTMVLPTDYDPLHNQYNQVGRLVATAFRDKLNDPWSYKIYGYDYRGRINCLWLFDPRLNSWKKIQSDYDNYDHLAKQNINSEYYYWYEYDNQGRLIKTKSNNFDSESN
jgi:hypothetical protein